MKPARPLYLAHTQPGFEAIAADEAQQRLDRMKIESTYSVGDKNGLLLFRHSSDVDDVLALRTVEDVFVIVADIPNLPTSREGLRELEYQIYRTQALEPALNLLRQARPGRRFGGKLQFRVVSRQIERAAYRRVDAQTAVERAISARTDHKWRLAEENAIELWLTLLPGRALLALRLSDEQMRHRRYQVAHLSASLRPSAAAALCWLTEPQPDDVFLDPMCGAGTLLIERAELEQYRALEGGDIRDEAVTAALRNIGPRYKPIRVQQWDATQLPLDAASVSAAGVNLPFGKQIGTMAQNRVLYPAFLREMARVLRPESRLVVLTSDMRTFEEALRRSRDLAKQTTYRVQILGQPATVYQIERR
ncbi:MAG TPA: hypothetical protein VGD69_22690 [Herpetosiphonaceae bacterium]